jgi:hypothetical protein
MHRSDVILYAENEKSDAYLLYRALIEAGVISEFVLVPDGKAVIGYLSGAGPMSITQITRCRAWYFSTWICRSLPVSKYWHGFPPRREYLRFLC